MSTITNISSVSFSRWVWQQKGYLLLSAGMVLLQFLVFKGRYPYPNFLPDSFSYLEAAMDSRAVNVWPIGYSRFLEWFGFFTRSHFALTLLQYVLLQVAVLYFVFSIAWFLRPGKWLFRIMLCSSVLNPLLLHVSNFVSSDALFAALSLVWLTQLIWIICRPGIPLLLWHALVLTAVFTVRYNAMYYPFISMGAVMLTTIPRWKKWAAVTIIAGLLGGFIGYTQLQYDKVTGRALFSPFGGWQLASNALFAYAQVPTAARSAPPFNIKQLQSITDRHMDSVQQLSRRPDAVLGPYYLWDARSPLRQFLPAWWGSDPSSGFKRWALTGPIYNEFGSYLIRHYPAAYLQHYILPNLVHYYVPPPEFLASYNMGKDTVEPAAVSWFGWKNNKVHSNTSGPMIRMGDYFPLALALTNLLFVLSFAGWVLLKGFSRSPEPIKKIGSWFLLVWLCNMGFSVLASPVVLRYQVFPMLATQTLMLWLLAGLIKAVRPAAVPVVIQQEVKSPFI